MLELCNKLKNEYKKDLPDITVVYDIKHLIEAEKSKNNTDYQKYKTKCEELIKKIYRKSLSNRSDKNKAKKNLINDNEFENFTRKLIFDLNYEREKVLDAESNLEELSEKFQKMVYLFGNYGCLLINAAKYFDNVINRSKNENYALKYAHRFFCGVCIYLILKRFLLIKLGSLLIKAIFFVIKIVIKNDDEDI